MPRSARQAPSQISVALQEPSGSQNLQKCAGSENLNSPEWVEHDQVGVAGDNAFRLPANGKFQELIVLGITASNDLHIDVDPLGLARQSGEKAANIFLIDVTAELLPAQNFVEFSKDGKREQNFSAP
jgi:hypothetical protein